MRFARLIFRSVGDVAAPLVPVLISLSLVAACQPRSAAVTPTGVRADSLVLERSRCFGSCPAYRLSVDASGRFVFASRAPRDSSVVQRDSIAPGALAWLTDEASRIGFFALPAVIADDKALCPLRATDHPTATVSIFHADSSTQVIDYRGCYADTDLSVAPPLARLRHFESQIDSVTRSARWTRAMLRP